MTLTLNYKFIKMSPRKLRPTAAWLKNQSIEKAISSIELMENKKSQVFIKLIKNALEVAKSKNIDPSKIKIISVQVNDGPRLKRSMPVARGRSARITKSMSHVRINLSDSLKRTK